MPEAQLIELLVVIAVVIALFGIVWFVLRRRKTSQLRDKFGDEYDRTVDTVGGRSGAERNLEEREKRVAQFDIRPLSEAERDSFTTDWKDAKALFVDSPQEAVLRADRLLATMMEARGYPMADFDRRYEDLTVDHATVARHYRDGHDIAEKRDEATTEEMRRALNHYEKLFAELVSDTPEAADTDVTTTEPASDGQTYGDSNTASMTANGRPVRPD